MQAFIVYSVLGSLIVILIRRKFTKSKKQKYIEKRVELFKKFPVERIKPAYFIPLEPPDWMEIEKGDDLLNDLRLKTKFS